MLMAARPQVAGRNIMPLNKGLVWRQMTGGVFSVREPAEVHNNEKTGAFLRGPTRKEAFAKAGEVVLSLDISAFDVILRRPENPRPVQLSNPQYAGWVSDGATPHLPLRCAGLRLLSFMPFRGYPTYKRWRLCLIDPLADFVAALTVNGAMFPSRLERNPLLREATWKI